MKRTIAAFLMAVLLAACASTQGSGPRRSANVLTSAEIAESGIVSTAAEVVRQLRPQWLATRAVPTAGSGGGDPPTLYLDGVRMEGIRELERIRAAAIERMEYLRPSDATNRFGTNHTGGAILVITR